jgi:type I restriction enzyme S subunit
MVIRHPRLDEIAEVRLGRQRSPKNHLGNQMRAYMRAANVGWGGLILDDVKTMNFTDAEMNVYRLAPGDILLGEASGSAKEVGKPALWNGEMPECAFQNTLLRVRPHDADYRYLFHFFKFLAESGRFAAQSRGVGIFHLGREALASWRVPLPPRDQQRQIAGVLDRADALRGKRGTSLTLLDNLTASIFHDTFGDPASSPWPIHTVGELCLVKGGKRLPKGSEYAKSPTPFRYIRVTDLRNGSVDQSSLLHLRPEVQRQIARYTVETDDVIISIAGSIGLVAPVPAALSGANLTENAAKLVPRRHDSHTAGYLAAALATDVVQSQIRQQTGQVTIGKLALFRIEKLLISVPPLQMQQTFDRRVSAARSLGGQLGTAATTLDALFVSLQERAFSEHL